MQHTEQGKLKFILLGQRHRSLDGKPRDLEIAVRSQMMIAQYILKNPNLPVVAEEQTKITSKNNLDKFTVNKIEEAFSGGFPEKIENLTHDQKACLYSYGAPVVLLALGLMQTIYPSIHEKEYKIFVTKFKRKLSKGKHVVEIDHAFSPREDELMKCVKEAALDHFGKLDGATVMVVYGIGHHHNLESLCQKNQFQYELVETAPQIDEKRKKIRQEREEKRAQKQKNKPEQENVLLTKLFQALTNKQLDAALSIIKDYPRNQMADIYLITYPETGLTVFKQICRDGYVELLENILKIKPIDNTSKEEQSILTASLKLAIRYDRAEITEILLKNGTDIQSLLHSAMDRGKSDELSMILMHVDKDNLHYLLKQSLFYALNNNVNIDIVRALIECGADVSLNFEKTLTSSVVSNQIQMVELLLSSLDRKQLADNIKAINVAFMKAISKDHLEIAKLLLEKGANIDFSFKYNPNPHNQWETEVATPLSTALKSGNMATIQFLKKEHLKKNLNKYIQEIDPSKPRSAISFIFFNSREKNTEMEFSAAKALYAVLFEGKDVASLEQYKTIFAAKGKLKNLFNDAVAFLPQAMFKPHQSGGP